MKTLSILILAFLTVSAHPAVAGLRKSYDCEDGGVLTTKGKGSTVTANLRRGDGLSSDLAGISPSTEPGEKGRLLNKKGRQIGTFRQDGSSVTLDFYDGGVIDCL